MRYEKTDGPGLPRCPLDQSVRFQRQDHLVNRGRGDSEVLLHFGFRGGAAVDFAVVVNERQILARLRGVRSLHLLPEILLRTCAGASKLSKRSARLQDRSLLQGHEFLFFRQGFLQLVSGLSRGSGGIMWPTAQAVGSRKTA